MLGDKTSAKQRRFRRHALFGGAPYTPSAQQKLGRAEHMYQNDILSHVTTATSTFLSPERFQARDV